MRIVKPVSCFVEDCPRTASTTRDQIDEPSRIPQGWRRIHTEDGTKYACPDHLEPMLRTLGIPDEEPIDV